MGKRVAFVVFTLVGTLVLLGLGTWQWQRRTEKREFIAAIEAAAKRPPKSFARAQVWDRVTITGRFLPDKVAYIRTSRPAPKPGERDSRGRVPVSGFGVWVMQAFEPLDAAKDEHGKTYSVLVSRGFLPTLPNGAIPPFETPSGEVTLTGFLRPGEKEGVLPPYNDPAKGVFFFRDAVEIARKLQLAGTVDDSERHLKTYTHFIDREARPDESAPPFGIEARDFLKSIPNNHLEYAITWWSLAATNIAVAGFFLFARRRRKPGIARDENAVTDAN
jgi:surfeit locus 1 family protein